MPDLPAGSLADATATPPAAPPAAAVPEPFPSPFADIVAGSLPAVSLAPIHEHKTDPAQEFVVSNFDKLGASGLGYHETPDNHTVIFNEKLVTPEQLDAADKAGKLFDVAPLVKDLKPVAAPAAPAASPVAPPAAPLANATAAPTAGHVNRGVQTARLKSASARPAGPLQAISGRAI